MTQFSRIKRTTIRWELIRALSLGALEAATSSIFLLIAIRHFNAPAHYKALIVSGASIGNLLAPFSVASAQYFRLRASRVASFFFLLAALVTLLPTLSENMLLYVSCCVFCSAFCGLSIPFVAQMYQENYPPREIGKIVSRVQMVRIISSAVTAYFGGSVIEGAVGQYAYLVLALSALLLLASFALFRCPTSEYHSDRKVDLLSGFEALKTNRSFQINLLGWMLLGFGSFLVLPLRTEYLSNPRYGLRLTEVEIAILVIAIPNIGRLLVTPIWGWSFDKFHFRTVRSAANLISICSILTFFTSDSTGGLILGSLMQGISIAGGELTWMLWTTKLAEGDKVANLMSIHTFLTGVRGVIAPQVGFHLAEQTSPAFVAVIGGILMFSSIGIFFLEKRFMSVAASEYPKLH